MDASPECERPAEASPAQRPFWRALFDDHPAPAWLIAGNTLAILDANAAALVESGYERGEIVGRPWTDLAPATPLPLAAGPVQWTYRAKGGNESPMVGEAFVVSINGEPAFAVRSGGPARRHEELLDALGQFAGGVAHEFNNLLTVIGGYTELLEHSLSLDGSVPSYLNELRQAVQRAAQRTSQLLAFGRRQAILTKHVDLNGVIRALEPRLNEHLGPDIELVMDLDPDLGPAFADAEQIIRVVMVLAENACEAMPLGGTLTIATEDAPNAPGGPAVCVRVVDTGAGMIEPVRGRLFEPFFTTKGPSRDGLGLATAYGAVAQCGGHIEVDSTPGEGSTFRVYWPRPTTASEMPAPVGSGTGRGTILLVEDDIRVRSLLGVVLRQEGYAVLEAADARGAMEQWEGHSDAIDLLLTDLFMPVLNGRDLAARLRAKWPSLPVVYMTGYSEAELMAVGAIPEDEGPILRKPFKPESLVQIVRHLLEN